MSNEDESRAYTRRDINKLVTLGSMGFLMSGSSAFSYASENTPLHFKSLLDVAKLIENNELRPTQLTQYLLDRIDAVDGELDSYVTVMSEHAIESAQRAEAEINAGHYRGPLHGIPIGIKDLCFTSGIRTMAGTKIYSDFVPEFDATVVGKLKAAGAVIIGKQTLCEGAHGAYHPGLQVPVNPWDSTKWTGVSSSGSGVAAAAGLCFGSVGTDTGGSIRYPSATNGCVGLKPTYGRVSRYGVFALAESMDHIGPMTRTVGDAAAMFEAMAGYDVNDPTSLNEPVHAVLDELSKGVAGLRIGFDHSYASLNVDPEVAQSIRDVIALLESLGAEIINVQMPDTANTGAAWLDLEGAEAVIANEAIYPGRADEIGPGFRAVLEYGQQLSAADYVRAAKLRAEFAGRFNAMLSEVDCFVCPTMGNVASPKLNDPYAIDTEASWESLVENDIFAVPANFNGAPTLSVPCGFSPDGLPISVQFISSHLNEAMICRVGHAFEANTSWHSIHPQI